jgi:hypothetical protein
MLGNREVEASSYSRNGGKCSMTYEEFVNRIHSDGEFRLSFLGDPSETLRSIGLSLEENQLLGLVDALKSNAEARDPELDWFLSQVRKWEVGALDWFAPQIRTLDT